MQATTHVLAELFEQLPDLASPEVLAVSPLAPIPQRSPAPPPPQLASSPLLEDEETTEAVVVSPPTIQQRSPPELESSPERRVVSASPLLADEEITEAVAVSPPAAALALAASSPVQQARRRPLMTLHKPSEAMTVSIDPELTPSSRSRSPALSVSVPSELAVSIDPQTPAATPAPARFYLPTPPSSVHEADALPEPTEAKALIHEMQHRYLRTLFTE